MRDLVEQARRRGSVAALLGRLLLEEPGPDVAKLVADVPELCELGVADPDLAVEFERLFLRDVPLYESVFVGPDGQLGGAVARRVHTVYDEHGFTESERWRVAGPDHLGTELRFYAHLCAAEAAGWADDRPDEAARAVEAERRFLADHLGAWAGVAVLAVERLAVGSPYGRLAETVGEFVAAEMERLRAAPELEGMAPVPVEPGPLGAGPARVAAWLLAPGRSGVFLDAVALADVARRLAMPWRASDTRHRLRQLLEGAIDGGDLDAVARALRPSVVAARDGYETRAAECPGAARIWTQWQARAAETLRVLDRLSAPATRAEEEEPTGPVTIAVTGGDGAGRERAVSAIAGALARLGITTRLVVEMGPEVTAEVAAVLALGGDDALLLGTGVAALAFAAPRATDATSPEALVDEPQVGPSVVISVAPDSGPLAVGVDAPRGAPLLPLVRGIVDDARLPRAPAREELRERTVYDSNVQSRDPRSTGSTGNTGNEETSR